jgi:hypothetical protein
MTLPKKYDAASAPSQVLVLVNHLVPQLIVGEHPALVALREQFRCASIKGVEMTGHGFYVDFETPADVPLAMPSDFAGGNAKITLVGSTAPAGCVLFVRSGRLSTLEGYTFGDEGWAENARVLSVENVEPIVPEPTA